MKGTKEIQDKKLNARLYPIYKMISWDLLFYYSVIYLFLTQAKKISASQVLLGEAFFTASCFIIQIPIGLMVDRLGKKKSLVLANTCMCLYITILILAQNFTHILIAFFMDSIGYVIKGICETNILYDSLPIGKKRGGLYSTIDGLAVSRYYIVDAVTSLIAGFTFVINPYIPIILCLITNIISTILATKFKSIKTINIENKNRETLKEYYKQLKNSIKFVKKSNRIKCLLIFFALMSALIYNMTSIRSSVLEQIKLPEQYFGIVFAISQIAASICSNAQNIIHKKYKNTTLAHLGIPFTVSCILIGFLSMIGISFANTFMIILLFVIQGAIKGPYNVLIYRYLNNFTNSNIRAKLATIRSCIYNAFTIFISLFGAVLLHFSNASNTILIIGCMSTIAMILLLDYMRGKVGLKPDKYNKDDLQYSNLTKKK